jgi:hypothetical protein
MTCAPTATRTRDLPLRRRSLYPLSYRGLPGPLAYLGCQATVVLVPCGVTQGLKPSGTDPWPRRATSHHFRSLYHPICPFLGTRTDAK